MSLWDKQSYLTQDTIIIGGGIVGLSVGCSILEQNSKKRVVILERGIIPTGASTKNAGFICTDSFTEFLEDIDKMGESRTIELFFSRYQGFMRLLERLGAEACDAKFQGAFELLPEHKSHEIDRLKYANDLLRPIYQKDVFVLRNELVEQFGFCNNHIKFVVENVLEGQIDTGKAMRSLYKHFVSYGGLYLTGSEVKSYKENHDGTVVVNVKNTADINDVVFQGQNIVLCTNAYTNVVTKQDLDLIPGRGQVVVTKPIPGLKFKGIFHMDEGYYYFRDYYDRVIFGGGRNTDFEGETTLEIRNTANITGNLKRLLKEVILPNTPFEIDYEWSGIMCFSKSGKDKTPIVKKEGKSIYYGVRLNGMGVALASTLGDELAKMIDSKIISHSVEQIRQKL